MVSLEFDREELEAHVGGVNGLINKQIRATAVVESWFFKTKAKGIGATLVYPSDKTELRFLGGEVWSFKPNIPFKIYVSRTLYWQCDSSF